MKHFFPHTILLFLFILFFGAFVTAQIPSWVNQIESMQPPSFNPDTFNIEKYGAKQGNISKNTAAFKKAIAACTKNGGGVVLVSEGIWESGPIHMKSNVNLYLPEGATISFSKNFEDYLPVVLIQRGGYYCYNYSPPIYANECKNVAITGSGTIDGNGETWWPWKQNQPGMVELFKMGKTGVPIEKRVFGVPEKGVRPPFVQFIKSQNIFIEGITFLDGPSWNIHPVQSENIIIRNITIEAHGPNNDGIDPDGCKNVLIENCKLDVGDDNIALKSGRDEEAWRLGTPCEYVVVKNCVSLRGHGGFVIGSEMSAGIKNVFVDNCKFKNTDRGIRLKTRMGRGGYIKNLWIRDIRMQDIKKEAIVINMQYDGEKVENNLEFSSSDQAVPKIHNINIKNVTCRNAGEAIKLLGLGKQTLYDISLKNIDITAKKEMSILNAKNISIDKLKINKIE